MRTPRAQSVREQLAMASRYGTDTSESRCHPLWLAFSNCMTSADTASSACKELHADFLECMHGKREVR